MSLQRLATVAEFGWLAVAVGAHGAALAFCVRDQAEGASAAGDFVAEILRPIQLTILPLWLILGPGRKRLRWIAVPTFVGLLYLWSFLPFSRVGSQAFWLELETAAILLALSVAVRLCGGRIQHAAGKMPVSPLQFSIRGLLVATTFAALFTAAGKWAYANVQAVAHDGQPDLLDLNPLIARTSVAAGLAIISLAAWWSVFRPRAAWPACLVVAALSGACGMLMTVLLHESDAWLSFGLWWLLHAMAIMATLAPLRQIFRLAASQAAVTLGGQSSKKDNVRGAPLLGGSL